MLSPLQILKNTLEEHLKRKPQRKPTMPIDTQDQSYLPTSLGTHDIPPERLKPIQVYVERLSQTALAVSDSLPFSADVSDFLRALNDNAEQ
ncbi:MAG: hypothetical protein ACR2PG_10100 [Hyphomicrobiaceae bacterium]